MQHRPILLLVTCLLFLSCAGSAGNFPLASSSRIRGFSTHCDGQLSVRAFDDESASTRLDVLPGLQHLRVSYNGRPYLSDEDGPQFVVCRVRSEHSLSFSTKPGRRYWFYVDDQGAGRHIVSVLESVDSIGPESITIQADAEQMSAKKECYLDGRFSGCFGPHATRWPF